MKGPKPLNRRAAKAPVCPRGAALFRQNAARPFLDALYGAGDPPAPPAAPLRRRGVVTGAALASPRKGAALARVDLLAGAALAPARKGAALVPVRLLAGAAVLPCRAGADRRYVAHLGVAVSAPALPDECPDLPFLRGDAEAEPVSRAGVAGPLDASGAFLLESLPDLDDPHAVQMALARASSGVMLDRRLAPVAGAVPGVLFPYPAPCREDRRTAACSRFETEAGAGRVGEGCLGALRRPLRRQILGSKAYI